MLFVWFVCLCLTPLSTVFQLYRCGQFYWWRKPEEPEKNHRSFASHWQTLSHNVVHLALIEIRTHNISGDSTESERYLQTSDFGLHTSKFRLQISESYYRIFPVIGSCIFTPNRRYLLLSVDIGSSVCVFIWILDVFSIFIK